MVFILIMLILEMLEYIFIFIGIVEVWFRCGGFGRFWIVM